MKNKEKWTYIDKTCAEEVDVVKVVSQRKNGFSNFPAFQIFLMFCKFYKVLFSLNKAQALNLC